MSDLKPRDILKIRADRGAEAAEPVISIRVSPHSYLAALLLATYLSAFSFYLELDLVGGILFGLSLIVIPFLAFNDRVLFDGRRLTRAGLLPRLWASFNRSRRRLKITDVEQVETQAVRALRRGGNVFYRYRTMIRGKGLSITITSGAKNTQFRPSTTGEVPVSRRPCRP